MVCFARCLSGGTDGKNGIDGERGAWRATAETVETTGRTGIIFILEFLCCLCCRYRPYSPHLLFCPCPPQSAREISCQKGAECYTRQKCHRWVVLDVRPIGGIFSRGRNRPLITRNYLMAIASISTRAPIGSAATW